MFPASAIFVFAVSLVIGLMIALGRHVFPAVGRRGADDIRSVQAAHKRVTPRLGGVAIVVAMCVGTVFWFTSVDVRLDYAYFLLTIIPLFVVGVMEDLGYFASPRRRLAAAAVSGIFFIVVFQAWLPRVDIPFVDLAFAWPPLAIALTIFICVGVTHAFNLIDGVNGLASTVAIVAAFSLATIAHQAGLPGHRDAMLLVSVAIGGFLVLNFPFGWIFLGDAGAYVIGHVLVWTAVSILWLAPDVSAFAILLVFFWPVADTLLAIWRRLSNGKPVSAPDRLHFHQLVMRAIEISSIGRQRRSLSNPLTTIAVLPLALAPMGVAVLQWNSVAITAFASGAFGLVFIIAYILGLRWSRGSRRRFSSPTGQIKDKPATAAEHEN
jgi:UDP-GlcNAc:undecaprenyl-phosphate/decaprenyl-phosphate GlcNAc-1-phosphate transferase